MIRRATSLLQAASTPRHPGGAVACGDLPCRVPPPSLGEASQLCLSNNSRQNSALAGLWTPVLYMQLQRTGACTKVRCLSHYVTLALSLVMVHHVLYSVSWLYISSPCLLLYVFIVSRVASQSNHVELTYLFYSAHVIVVTRHPICPHFVRIDGITNAEKYREVLINYVFPSGKRLIGNGLEPYDFASGFRYNATSNVQLFFGQAVYNNISTITRNLVADYTISQYHMWQLAPNSLRQLAPNWRAKLRLYLKVSLT